MSDSLRRMDSITGLFNQLLDACINKGLLHPQLNVPNTRLDKHRRALWVSLYSTLFANLNGPLQSDNKDVISTEDWNDVGNEGMSIGVKERLLQVVFERRRQRKCDEAHQLEGLVSSLPNVDNGHHPELKAALQLLLALAGSDCNHHQKPPVGHKEPSLPVVGLKNKDEHAVVLPSGPRYHGDSCHVYHQGYQGYIHYSRDLFEGQQLEAVQSDDQGELRNYRMLQNKLFEAEPGRDLLGNGLFTLKPSEDEGFHESSSLSTPATETPVTRDDNVWQKALDYQPNQHHTWETIGNKPRTTERPYLTEAGSRMFDEMYKLRCLEASVLDASLERPLLIIPDQVQLVQDSVHVLLSVPSETFRLDKEAQCFVINPDVCLTGTTPGSFNQLLTELAQAGTDHCRLSSFAQQRVLDSTYTGGLVLQAFTSGIRRFLQYYQAAIMRRPSSDGKVTVMTIKAMYGKMIQQLRYLADLCGCNHPLITKPGDPRDTFPLGIKLLSYLYEEALDCSLQDRYQLVLSLLRSSCGPYLMFIQDWVFNGICRDVFGEFLISVSDEYLHYRDKHYWTQGFVMKSDSAEENVPLFLKDLAYDIYVCGKSLNLLRLCCPEHFLCNPGVSIPRISLTFSTEELDNSAKRTAVYIGHMQALARQKTISRQEQELMESEARQALISQARQAASEELKRLQDAIQERRMVEDAKKRQEFQQLKDQMQRDLVRRALTEEAERQEDIERMDALTKREEGEARAQYEVEQKVREEMIEYYAQLTEEAAARERKALWRVSRHQLDQARLKFMVQEEMKIREELANKQSTMTPLDIPDNESKGGSGVGESSKGTTVASADRILIESGARQDLETLHSVNLPTGSSNEAGASKMRTHTVPPYVATQEASQEPNLPQADLLTGDAPSGLIPIGTHVEKTDGLPNEDIEGTLQMIGQSSGDDRSMGTNPTRVEATPNLMDLSIQDFLPREPIEDDGLEMASSNDADVEDVLIQIGSSLPSKVPNQELSSQHPPAINVVDEMLGLPSFVDPALPATSQAHPSDSVAGDIIYSSVTGHSAPTFLSTRGGPADSRYRVGYESTEGEMRPVIKSSHRHAGDSSLGDILYPTDKKTQPPGICAVTEDSSSQENLKQESTSTGHIGPSGSRIAPLPTVSVEQSSSAASAKDSKTSYSFSQGNQSGREGRVKRKSAFGHAGDSTLGDVLYPSATHRQVSDLLSKNLDSVMVKPDSQSASIDHDTSSRVTQFVTQVGAVFKLPVGHASDSTIQTLLHPHDQQTVDVKRQPDRTSLVAVHHSQHPSDSTAQNVIYGRGRLDEQRGAEMEKQTVDNTDSDHSMAQQAVVVWTGQGVELFQDNFEALDKPPMPDLLSNIGFMPLTTEIGDYGLQAAESESIDAVELQSLPIIMKRSVTSPLLAQISLVNQSILDYFMVELKIGQHFKSIRSFLFLEDGEFGQSLCDQLFDKLSQGMRPNELLTPIVLNQVLARAIQNSANRESQYTNNLGFSLKYLPHHFKPNAIDTFDCLELRYRVDWPCNIVITDTCLAKYNRVFSFLLQLKRISWVLRDIYFQLKRSAMVSHADNSPQFRQLQLFRHEMQHFVNVMQGYVANQVIHVSWEEFQRQLKTEVYNLDDLHQKHAEYLNKAVFRCLLNKKAAPVMKIISDILCLILKVRTQLVATAWVYNKETKQASHPGFHTIKMSYLAFKDYSEFLYKVVAKLVTRGYQPHLEEFMLRLNFNDFYKDS
ncbi:gamma-tubulin complex component 6-like isoform X2 [Acanthaster planci]|uniref:Gamma-tubulin complex component 6 n=1 Tax=Acanthaster planci TaxID=133434 RepID=A0A8B7Z3G9_ACAPL|nr:gamma-tubulin complex component 6-like isoform X2 [Acanthaster planci]